MAGLPADKAVEFWLKAAEQKAFFKLSIGTTIIPGVAEAENLVGVAYLEGKGVGQVKHCVDSDSDVVVDACLFCQWSVMYQTVIYGYYYFFFVEKLKTKIHNCCFLTI